MKSRKDGQFKPRLGRIRSLGNAKRGRTFLSRVSRAVNRAGYMGKSSGKRLSGGGRYAGRRRVIVKARIVRASAASKVTLRKHLNYLGRDEATREKDKGKLFDEISDDADRKLFAKSTDEDRHHFRFIVSPEDGSQIPDLKPFVRDLMTQMSKDLGTELDWVSAVHTNTEHPHAHIVLRGRRNDGSDLVIPRQYIAHGIRERAVDLVTLELGPQTRLEHDASMAREIDAQRLTRTDHALIRSADPEGKVDVNQTSARYRTHNIARLRTLERMKLARQTGPGQWQLSKDLSTRLRKLGERGDIIKALHKSAGHRYDRVLDADYALRHNEALSRNVTGAVLDTGLGGEFHDQKYAVIDTLDGRIVKAPLEQATDLSELKTGAIVELKAQGGSLKPSDRTIDQIARNNCGTYSPTLHQEYDPRATPSYVAAHVRRLEALRRAHLVERHSDGTWTVPKDHLSRVETYERNQARKRPLQINVLSQLPLSDQVTHDGLTWLDMRGKGEARLSGFNVEVGNADIDRRSVLRARGLLEAKEKALTPEMKNQLHRHGLKTIANRITQQTGKQYQQAPSTGSIEGVYSHKVQAGDGAYAVIEKKQSFTLVRWRRVLERGKGISVSGIAKAGKISWSIGGGRTKGLSR